jgi:hypothetical protein
MSLASEADRLVDRGELGQVARAREAKRRDLAGSECALKLGQCHAEVPAMLCRQATNGTA